MSPDDIGGIQGCTYTSFPPDREGRSYGEYIFSVGERYL